MSAAQLVERLQLQGVTWVDPNAGRMFLVPVPDGEGTWLVLTADSVDYTDSPSAALQVAGEMAARGWAVEAEAWRQVAYVMAGSR